MPRIVKDELRQDQRGEENCHKGKDSKQRKPEYKAFKRNLKGLEDFVFENRAMRHAAQFTNALNDFFDCIQIKFNSDVACMIREVEWQLLFYPARPTWRTMTLNDWTTTWEKADEMVDYFWKKAFKKRYNNEAEFEEKEK